MIFVYRIGSRPSHQLKVVSVRALQVGRDTRGSAYRYHHVLYPHCFGQAAEVPVRPWSWFEAKMEIILI